MVEIEANVEHHLGQEQAVERLHEMVNSLEERFRDQVHRVKSEWVENVLDISFAAYGFQIEWQATVLDDRVTLMGRIPPTAKMFRGKIERAIVARVEDMLRNQPTKKAA